MAAKERLKSRILRLLKEDEEFRYAVAGLIGMEEILKRLDRNEQEIARLREDMIKGFERHDREIQRLTEEMTKLREDMIKGFERHDVELAKLREDMIKGFERHDREIERLREDMVKGFERHDMEIQRLTEEMNRLREDMMRGFELMDRRVTRLENLISALGARWGIMAEDAFREGLRGILEKELGLKVERWIATDEEGIVYGFESVIEIDVAIKDGKTLLIEVSSSVDRSKVAAFVRKAQLYERRTGIRPDRLIMVTPYAEKDAVEAAGSLGVEIYTRV